MGVYPVVHVISTEQSVEQAAIVADSGADGMFLIGHDGSRVDRLESLLESYNRVSEAFPDMKIGINYLSMDPLQGYRFTQESVDSGLLQRAPDALWFDDAIAGARTIEAAKAYLEKVRSYRETHPDMKKVRLFGGVSFKYTQSYTDDPLRSARLAEEFAPYIDVLTTSGSGTGSPPSPEKIKSMKNAHGVGRLAVASGIDEQNFPSYNGEIDDVLIASSLETKPYSGIFIPDKVRSFVVATRKS